MIILNFHGIGPIPHPIDAGEKSCWIEVEHLLAILDLIQHNKDILLTIDDGNKSDISIFLPELQKRKLNCIFFICTSRIGRENYLNYSDIKLLKSEGMTIGSHGKHHIRWTNLNKSELQNDLTESKDILQSITGDIIDKVACPFGAYNKRTIDAIKYSGFKTIYTSDTGPCRNNEWIQSRNTIKQTTQLNDIRQLLNSQNSVLQYRLLRIKMFLKRSRY